MATKEEKQEYIKLTNSFEYARNNFTGNSKAKMIAARKRMFFIYNCKSKVKATKSFIDNLDKRFILFTSNTKVSKELSNNCYNSKNKSDSLINSFIDETISNIAVVKMADMGITFPNLKTGIIQQVQSNEEIFLQRALRCCNLDNNGEIAKIYIFVCKNTVDESWLEKCLKEVDKEKIKYL